MAEKTEVAAVDDSFREELKQAILEAVKDLIKESATSEELKNKINEVVEELKKNGLVDGYLGLSKSRQKYVLAGVALVVGFVLGGFAHSWILSFFVA